MNQAEALQLLQDLGTNADEIAQNLSQQGITGRKSYMHSCPIANYLKKHGARSAAVGIFSIQIFDSSLENETFRTPLPVVGFIAKFDYGIFPDLMEPEVDSNTLKEQP